MKIIFGQGNPGKAYEKTRHNIGFFMVDELAKKHSASFTSKPKFSAEIAEAMIGNEKVLFVKPTTFYNETGVSARALIDFYKLDASQDFLVIHDELALPFGTMKARLKGSDAGNNGIKSLNAHLNRTYNRLRVGVASPKLALVGAHDFVLENFTSEEAEAFPHLLKTADEFCARFVTGSFDAHKVMLEL